MNFSQRMGLEPAAKPLQKDSMDLELRNGLWNAFKLFIVQPLEREWALGGQSSTGSSLHLFVNLWFNFFKWRLDQLPDSPFYALETVKNWYFNPQVSWNKIYDFVQFIGNLGRELQAWAADFMDACNLVLEREFSAYRFVNGKLTPITNEAEIKAIEQAASLDSSLLRPVCQHIDTALKLLADRTNPDYRNSMKESISAVEAICKLIAQNDKATLGPALDAVKARITLHPKLHEAFKAMYGYTNDAHGIRHALKDDAEPEAEDAMFMLVSCSAFVNYLVEKSRKNGLLPKEEGR
jgi:hypothetical protein